MSHRFVFEESKKFTTKKPTKSPTKSNNNSTGWKDIPTNPLLSTFNRISNSLSATKSAAIPISRRTTRDLEFEDFTPDFRNCNSISPSVLIPPERSVEDFNNGVEDFDNRDIGIYINNSKQSPINPPPLNNDEDENNSVFIDLSNQEEEPPTAHDTQSKEKNLLTEIIIDEKQPSLLKNVSPQIENINPSEAASLGTIFIANIKDWLWEVWKGVKEHPAATILGASTAAQPAYNAFISEMHTKTFEPAKWYALPPEMKALCLTELISSFLVNYPAGKKFIGDALGKLQDQTKDMCNSTLGFFDNIFSLVIGIDSGAGAAALTFNAFAWIATLSGVAIGGYAIPGVLAGLSFVISSTSRYLGFKWAIQIISNLFSHDANVQRQAIDQLKHLKLDENVILTAQHLASIGSDEKFANTAHSIREILQACVDKEAIKRKAEKDADEKIKNKNLNAEDYEYLFLTLVNAANELDKLHPNGIPSIFNKKTIKEYIAEYVNIASKLSFALTFGLPAGAIFTQEGFNAVAIVSKLVFDFDMNTNNLDVWYKRLIGLCSGIGSGVLYAVCSADFPKLFFVELPLYLWQHPQHIPAAILLVVINFFASYSMRNVTENIMQAENILGLLNEFKKELPYIVQLGSAFVNIRSKLMEYKIAAKDPNKPELEEVIKQNEDPNIRRISKPTVDLCYVAMNGSSFFAEPTNKTSVEDDSLTFERNSMHRGV